VGRTRKEEEKANSYGGDSEDDVEDGVRPRADLVHRGGLDGSGLVAFVHQAKELIIV